MVDLYPFFKVTFSGSIEMMTNFYVPLCYPLKISKSESQPKMARSFLHKIFKLHACMVGVHSCDQFNFLSSPDSFSVSECVFFVYCSTSTWDSFYTLISDFALEFLECVYSEFMPRGLCSRPGNFFNVLIDTRLFITSCR